MTPWPGAIPRSMWVALRRLVAVSVLLVYASYSFVLEPPQALFRIVAPGQGPKLHLVRKEDIDLGKRVAQIKHLPGIDAG